MCNVLKFDPRPAVIKQLPDKKRHIIKTKVHSFAKQQEWYKGVFEESSLPNLT